MIDLYTWPTPNGHKIHVMLEETGLEYTVHPIDISAGDQFEPARGNVRRGDGPVVAGTPHRRQPVGGG